MSGDVEATVTKPAELALFHWSPATNRRSIDAYGLRPGFTSNDDAWKPPHICLAETPSAALGLTHATGVLDLWMVRCDPDSVRKVESEWRADGPLPAWWVASRPSDACAVEADNGMGFWWCKCSPHVARASDSMRTHSAPDLAAPPKAGRP